MKDSSRIAYHMLHLFNSHRYFTTDPIRIEMVPCGGTIDDSLVKLKTIVYKTHYIYSI